MPRTVLAAGSVLDVVAGRVARADVAMEGDRIVDVAPDLAGDSVVDAGGCLLVPGFIDCHTHVALTEILGAAAPDRLPRSALALSVVPVLRTLLDLGITTVRDAWGADAGVRLAIERAWVEGPQVLISLRQMCTTGGIGDHWSPELGGAVATHDPSMPDPVFDGPDAARAAVRRMVQAGADWIKVALTGSMFQGRRAHDLQMTAAELAALIDEAARQGDRPVMVHAHGARAAEMAARLGARSVEHGVWLDEAAAAAMAAAGAWFVPTLSVTQAPSDRAVDGAREAHLRSVRTAIAAGVPIAMGTDSPVRPHREALREIAYLADAGLGPLGALRAATWEGARLLGMEDDRGAIAAGKRADVVVLAGPALDVSDLERRIVSVWHNGRRADGERAQRYA